MKKLLCRLFGHRFIVVSWFARGNYIEFASQLYCARCEFSLGGSLSIGNDWSSYSR